MMSAKLNINAQAVLEVVQAASNHPTALDIYETVKQRRPAIGLASVYRILHHLVEQGHIREMGRVYGCCRYDANVQRHDHAVCTECGALLDVPVDITLPTEILQAAATATGIKLSSHELRIYGRCHACCVHA